MSPPKPIDRRAFLRAVDGTPSLRAFLEQNHGQELHYITSFRKRIGDNCNYVLAALKKIWYDAWERHPDVFQQHLRSAGYPL